MSLFEELKRRNVVRIAALYVVASWVILQIADVLFENLGVPDFAFRLVLGLLLLGFPVALMFSWVYELTPEGLKREKDIDRSQSITTETGKRMNRLIVALLVLVIVGLVGERWLWPQLKLSQDSAEHHIAAATETDAGEAAAGERTLAVLPFVNMSGDEENEYFSDGLSEELLNSLARIPELQVTGRTSSFAFKGKNQDLREIGEKLNVAHVLEGSVRKASDRVRITAQLINTTNGYHLWSETYDRQLDDIFAIQTDIAERVATALSATLLGTAHASDAGETSSAAAYEAYLRGNHVLQRNPDDLDTLNQALASFEQALQYDSSYIQAWFGIYKYWNRRHRNGLGELADNLLEIQAVSDRMASIAPNHELTLLAQARVELLNYHWPTALELYQTQIELHPGSAESMLNYATAMALTGDLQGEVSFIERVLELDPLSLNAMTRLTVPQYLMGDCAAVRQTAQRVLELAPNYGRVRGAIGYCLLMHGGDVTEAIDWLNEEPTVWMAQTGLAIAHDRLGDTDRSQQLMQKMMREYSDTAAFQYAQILAQTGDIDQAIFWLKKAYEERDPGFIQICSDLFIKPLRNDPRFAELVQKTGFEECPNPG